jgi:hypothetical protein
MTRQTKRNLLVFAITMQVSTLIGALLGGHWWSVALNAAGVAAWAWLFHITGRDRARGANTTAPPKPIDYRRIAALEHELGYEHDAETVRGCGQCCQRLGLPIPMPEPHIKPETFER